MSGILDTLIPAAAPVGDPFTLDVYADACVELGQQVWLRHEDSLTRPWCLPAPQSTMSTPIQAPPCGPGLRDTRGRSVPRRAPAARGTSYNPRLAGQLLPDVGAALG